MNQYQKEKLKSYLKEIKLLLPIYGKEERKFLKDLKSAAEEYLEQNPDSTYEEFLEHFEEPVEVVHNYVSSLEQEQLCKRISFRKNCMQVLIVLLIVIIVSLVIQTYAKYSFYQELKKSIPAYVVEVIE